MEYVKNYVQLCLLGDQTISERRQMIFDPKEIIEKRIEEYSNLLNWVNWKLNYYDNRMDGKNMTELFSKEVMQMIIGQKIADTHTNKR